MGFARARWTEGVERRENASVVEASVERRASVRARRPAEHWLVLALALVAVAGVVVLATLVEPDPRGYGTHEKLGLPPCRMLDWTGFPCPGCGVTTSIALAAHGHIAAAWHNQPFGLVVALLAPLAALWALVQHLRGRDLARELSRLRPGWWGIGAGLAAAAGWAWKIALVRGWLG